MRESERNERDRRRLTAEVGRVVEMRRLGNDLLKRFAKQFRRHYVETQTTDPETKRRYRESVRLGQSVVLMADRRRLFYFVYSNREERRRVSVDQLEEFIALNRPVLADLFQRHTSSITYDASTFVYACKPRAVKELRTRKDIVYLTHKRTFEEEEADLPGPRRDITRRETLLFRESPFHGLVRDTLHAGKDVDTERIRCLMDRGVEEEERSVLLSRRSEVSWIV